MGCGASRAVPVHNGRQLPVLRAADIEQVYPIMKAMPGVAMMCRDNARYLPRTRIPLQGADSDEEYTELELAIMILEADCDISTPWAAWNSLSLALARQGTDPAVCHCHVREQRYTPLSAARMAATQLGMRPPVTVNPADDRTTGVCATTACALMTFPQQASAQDRAEAKEALLGALKLLPVLRTDPLVWTVLFRAMADGDTVSLDTPDGPAHLSRLQVAEKAFLEFGYVVRDVAEYVVAHRNGEPMTFKTNGATLVACQALHNVWAKESTAAARSTALITGFIELAEDQAAFDVAGPFSKEVDCTTPGGLPGVEQASPVTMTREALIREALELAPDGNYLGWYLLADAMTYGIMDTLDVLAGVRTRPDKPPPTADPRATRFRIGGKEWSLFDVALKEAAFDPTVNALLHVGYGVVAERIVGVRPPKPRAITDAEEASVRQHLATIMASSDPMSRTFHGALWLMLTAALPPLSAAADTATSAGGYALPKREARMYFGPGLKVSRLEALGRLLTIPPTAAEAAASQAQYAEETAWLAEHAPEATFRYQGRVVKAKEFEAAQREVAAEFAALSEEERKTLATGAALSVQHGIGTGTLQTVLALDCSDVVDGRQGGTVAEALRPWHGQRMTALELLELSGRAGSVLLRDILLGMLLVRELGTRNPVGRRPDLSTPLNSVEHLDLLDTTAMVLFVSEANPLQIAFRGCAYAVHWAFMTRSHNVRRALVELAPGGTLDTLPRDARRGPTDASPEFDPALVLCGPRGETADETRVMAVQLLQRALELEAPWVGDILFWLGLVLAAPENGQGEAMRFQFGNRLLDATDCYITALGIDDSVTLAWEQWVLSVPKVSLGGKATLAGNEVLRSQMAVTALARLLSPQVIACLVEDMVEQNEARVHVKLPDSWRDALPPTLAARLEAQPPSEYPVAEDAVLHAFNVHDRSVAALDLCLFGLEVCPFVGNSDHVLQLYDLLEREMELKRAPAVSLQGARLSKADVEDRRKGMHD